MGQASKEWGRLENLRSKSCGEWSKGWRERVEWGRESLRRGVEGLRESFGGVGGIRGVIMGIIVMCSIRTCFTKSHLLPKWLKIEVREYFQWNPCRLGHQKPFF